MKSVLTYLRSNWFALLVIVVAILWWQIIDVFTPPNLDYDPTLINIDYWSLVTPPNWKPFVVFGFFGFAIIAGLLSYFYVVPNWKVIYRFVLLVVLFLMCVLSTCTSYSIQIEDSHMNHIMSVSYQGDFYHLDFYQSVAFLGSGSDSYYVFECDPLGNTCSKIVEESGESLYQAKLVVSENKLIYHYDTTNHQILPATN